MGLIQLVLAASLVGSALGHGLLLDPPSRNWQAYLKDHYDWAHELNAGGKWVVSKNCAFTWPAGQHGICGDKPGEGRWLKPGPAKTYKAGDTIKLQVIVQTNHMGRWDFNICPGGTTDESKCRPLERADGRGKFFYMPRIRDYNGGATGESAVPTERGPISSWSWFSMPHIDCGFGCDRNQFKGNTVYEVRYKLPDGFTCDGCFLQWHWLAGHNCWPPCDKADPTYPACKAPTYQLPFCGSPGSGYPEEYWNCADIKITK